MIGPWIQNSEEMTVDCNIVEGVTFMYLCICVSTEVHCTERFSQFMDDGEGMEEGSNGVQCI